MDGGDCQRLRTDVPPLDLRHLKVVSALGRGAKGVVFLVRPESSGDEPLALKAIWKGFIEKNKAQSGGEYRRVCFEQQVLGRFQHPLLPRLRGALDTDKIVGYAIDYCPGRDLNSLRKRQTEKMFSDDIIRFYAAELVLALEYLHGLGIVYRDLKPENILIQENGHLMLVDFDLSTKLLPKTPEKNPPALKSVEKAERDCKSKKKKGFLPFHKCCNSGISPEDSVSPPEPAADAATSESDSVSKSNSFVGTEEYVAPEIILGNGHDFAVDWWCLGVVLYEMLYGVTPFRGSNRKETFYRILSKAPELVGEQTRLRDLIAKLLEKDPERRISLEAIKGHDFFKGINWDLVLQLPRPPFIPTPTWAEGEEDTEGNQRIDVESFVQGVFKTEEVDGGDASAETRRNEDGKENGGPNQPDNFLIF